MIYFRSPDWIIIGAHIVLTLIVGVVIGYDPVTVLAGWEGIFRARECVGGRVPQVSGRGRGFDASIAMP